MFAVAFCSNGGESERIKCYKVVLSSSGKDSTSGGGGGIRDTAASAVTLQLRCTLVKGSISTGSSNVGSVEETKAWKLHRMCFTGTNNNFLVCCYKGSNDTGSILGVWDLTRGVICQRMVQQQQQLTFMDCCVSISNTILHLLFHDTTTDKYIIYEYTFTDANPNKDDVQGDEERQYLQLIRKIKAGSGKITTTAATATTTNKEATASWNQQIITANSSYISTLLPQNDDGNNNKLRFIDVTSGKRLKLQTSSSTRSSSCCCSISFMKDSNTIIMVYPTQNNNNDASYIVDLCKYESADDATSSKKGSISLSTTFTYEGLTSLPTHFEPMPNIDDETINNEMVVTCIDGTFCICVDNIMKNSSISNSATKLLLAFFHRILPNTVVAFYSNDDTKDISFQLYTYHHNVDEPTNNLVISLESTNNTGSNYPFAAADNKRSKDIDDTGAGSNNPSSADTKDNKNKRKSTTVVMGPGETLNVTSGSIHDIGQESKKAKKSSNHNIDNERGDDGDEDNDSSIWDIVCHEGTNVDSYMNSIAGRIAGLRRQIVDSDSDDSSLDGEKAEEGDETATTTITKKKPAQTTSNALTVILKQALQSSNEIQLEEAFTVNDETVVKATIASITDDDLIWTLLMKIIHRISKKPSRALWLGGVWLKTILEYHSSTFLKLSEEEGASLVYNALGPLANMLKDRTELLPHLMKLQGRFNMVSRRHGI